MDSGCAGLDEAVEGRTAVRIVAVVHIVAVVRIDLRRSWAVGRTAVGRCELGLVVVGIGFVLRRSLRDRCAALVFAGHMFAVGRTWVAVDAVAVQNHIDRPPDWVQNVVARTAQDWNHVVDQAVDTLPAVDRSHQAWAWLIAGKKSVGLYPCRCR
jgi:hypothetical protein